MLPCTADDFHDLQAALRPDCGAWIRQGRHGPVGGLWGTTPFAVTGSTAAPGNSASNSDSGSNRGGVGGVGGVGGGGGGGRNRVARAVASVGPKQCHSCGEMREAADFSIKQQHRPAPRCRQCAAAAQTLSLEQLRSGNKSGGEKKLKKPRHSAVVRADSVDLVQLLVSLGVPRTEALFVIPRKGKRGSSRPVPRAQAGAAGRPADKDAQSQLVQAKSPSSPSSTSSVFTDVDADDTETSSCGSEPAGA